MKLDAKAAAEYLGVSKQAVYCAAKKLKLQYSVQGTKFFFTKEALDEYYQNRYSRRYSRINGELVLGPTDFGVIEVAKKLDMNLSNVYYLLRVGLLDSIKKGATYVISQAALDDYIYRQNSAEL